MNQVLKNTISLIVITVSLMAFVVVAPVGAQTIDQNKTQACAAIQGGCPDQDASNTAFNNLWESILNTVAFVVGAVAVLMIVIGGFRYVLSQGDPQATQNAKNTILYALIGLVIAFIARGLVVFVINRI